MASLTNGGGGKSISATVEWVPIVSSCSSPAIRLLTQLRLRLGAAEDMQTRLEIAGAELRKLFTRGLAHPREMDESGKTLLTVRLVEFMQVFADSSYSMLTF